MYEKRSKGVFKKRTMTLFKNKKQKSALNYSLDKALETARLHGENYFYFTVLDGEYDKVKAWTVTHRLMIELSHKQNNNLVYKISGVTL